jgi:hypothetical protein
MGSPPTLDPTPTRPPATDRNRLDGQAELRAHLQTQASRGGHDFTDQPVDQFAVVIGGDLSTLHDIDHAHLARQLRHRHPDRDAERAFDRLNPTFGVPADRTDRIGHRDVHQREAALALGIRVAVHDARQNDPNPVIWQPGQDYRMADALHAARTQPTRTRHGPERVGPER